MVTVRSYSLQIVLGDCLVHQENHGLTASANDIGAVVVTVIGHVQGVESSVMTSQGSLFVIL